MKKVLLIALLLACVLMTGCSALMDVAGKGEQPMATEAPMNTVEATEAPAASEAPAATEAPAAAETAEPAEAAEETEAAPEATEAPAAAETAEPAEAGEESEAAPEATAGPAKAYLVVTAGGAVYEPIPLYQAGRYTLRRGDCVNVIEVTEDSIRMAESTCENQDCVEQGTVTLENKYSRVLQNMIICLPNDVALELYTYEEMLEVVQGWLGGQAQ